jgi:hypothetical protein
MATLVRDILYGAYGRSLKNQPQFIATEATELTQVVYRAMRGLFAAAARVNPLYFGIAATTAYTAPGWPRPSTAESIYRLETLAGTEVKVVPFDDRAAEPGFPTVYEFGQTYIPTLIGPVVGFGNLRAYFSKHPDLLTAITDYIDAMWPESFNELLILETAIYLALKDGRETEIGTLVGERDRWAKLYFAFLEHETTNEVRRFGAHARFAVRGQSPAWSLLAGNTPGAG